LMKR